MEEKRIVTPMMLTPLLGEEKQLEKTMVLMMPTQPELVEHGRRDDAALMGLARFFLSEHPQSGELLEAVHRQQVALFGEKTRVVWFLSAFGLEEEGSKILYVGDQKDRPVLLALNDRIKEYVADADIRHVSANVEPLVFTL